MCLGVVLFSVNDAQGKWLVATYSVGQILMIRSIAALAFLSPAIAREGWRRVAFPERIGLHIVRVILSTIEVAFFYWAVSAMPLAETITYYLASPIYVALLAGPLLGERIPLRRWIAIGIGFVGVVVALNPGGALFGWPALVAFAGSVAFAFMLVVTRTLRGSPDTTLVAWPMAAAVLGGAAIAPFHWVTPTPLDLVLIGLLGIVAMFAHICVNRSLKLAPASVVVPYQYTLIVWAVLLGWWVFGDVPAWSTLVGAAIIIAAGIWIFWDEKRSGQEQLIEAEVRGE